MPFLVTCPHCGPREATEFVPGGEVVARPAARPRSKRELSAYLYFRTNAAGPQREWWFHAAGCGRWLLATRDTTTGEVLDTSPPEEDGRSPSGHARPEAARSHQRAGRDAPPR